MEFKIRTLWQFHPFLLQVLSAKCIIILLFGGSAAPLAARSESDEIALLALKSMISTDPDGALRSWNGSLHFCKWHGVKCSDQHPPRVTSLNLTGQSLVGSLSPHISNLSFLSSIDLSSNSLQGHIPQEIGHLLFLRFLNLSANSLDGEIPKNLTLCKELRVLDLYDNKLYGRIPSELSSLTRLRRLVLHRNNFVGSIPPSIGNLSSVSHLDLSVNSLEGSIPSNLGRMVNLNALIVRRNNLLGTIPSTLYNLSAMTTLDVAYNYLHGSLPLELGIILPKLQELIFRRNKFTGLVPTSLSNASSIENLDFSLNNFSGPVPTNIGRLQGLRRLNFGINNLSGDLSFITSLTNCTDLELLSVGGNNFIGALPNSIANFSAQLQQLAFYQNQISGTIPSGIVNLVNLMRLWVQINLLTGPIPDQIGRLQKLQSISMHDNKLSGKIPASLGNITRLYKLHLYRNDLNGSIPQSLASLRHLKHIHLFYNNLGGKIPIQLLNMPSLLVLRLDGNSLIGSCTIYQNNLSLVQLNVSCNKLTGEIPSNIGNCMGLERLYMKGNFFQGSIPPSLSSLMVLQELDLSNNSLSGQIPKSLEQLSTLKFLNLSGNKLECEVPKHGIFRNLSERSIFGNSKLCGGIPMLMLPICPKQSSKKHTLTIVLIGVSVFLSLSLFFCFLITLFWLKKSRKSPSVSAFTGESIVGESFLEVTYSMLFKATDGFSSTNLIGIGSYGSVYRGVLEHIDMMVAIKVLKLQERKGSRSFIAECEALRGILHRNIIKILTVCSSIDSRGNDFKALVFQYMPSGSLDSWLHPNENEQFRNLNLFQRINIAIDVAYALDYLHHHCHEPIVHCDLKPSNILLDEAMVAHVGDFGLARILHKKLIAQSQTQPSWGLNGSIGYVAPEYGMVGNVTTSGDVYSYGIILLEMITGKRPTDEMFRDNQNLPQLAKVAFPERVLEITDHKLLQKEAETIRFSEDIRKIHECLISLVRIGLSCCAESPKERMKMNDVVAELHGVRDSVLALELYILHQSS